MEPNEAIKAIAGDGFKSCTIETDGTRAGTTIKVNGQAVPDLRVFSFSFFNDDYSNNVSLGFSTNSPAGGPGEFSKTTYFALVPPDDNDDDSAEASKATLVVASNAPLNLLPRGGELRAQLAQIGTAK